MIRIIVATVLIIVMAFPTPAPSKTPPKEQATHDPLFAIVYLASKVKFEPAPEAIFSCKDLKEPHRKLSLFGKATRNGTDFYYVFGLVEVDYGAGPTGEFETQNDDGIIVALSITDQVVTALLSDMIDREVVAFGGVSCFLQKVKAAGVPDSYQPPQVRARLEALRKKAVPGSTLPPFPLREFQPSANPPFQPSLQLFILTNTFGSEVILVEAKQSLLPREDQEAGSALQAAFEAQGMVQAIHMAAD